MMELKHAKTYYQSSFFKWRQRIGFGISDFACCLAYLLTNTYLLFYYTNCAGINAGAAGIMFVVTKFIDAITDYLVGTWIDRTDTKMGRYRPWMLAGAPVLAVGMVLLFSVPVSWAAGAKLAWAYITYIIFSFGYTLVNVPMIPIVNSLSADPVERTNIVTTKQILAALGSLTSSVFVLPLVRFFSGDENATGAALAYGYRMTNVVLGIIVIIILVACVMNVEEIIPPTVDKKEKNNNVLKDMKAIFVSKYYILLLADSFFYFLGYLGMMAAIQYYFTYIIGDTAAMSVAMALMTAVPIPIMLIAAKLVAKGIGKAKLMIFGGIIDLLALILMLFTKSATLTVALVGLWAVGMAFRNCLMFAAFPDVYDYTEYEVGKSLAGTQTAVMCFGSKVASALASAAISAFLVIANYDSVKETLDNLLASGGTVQDIAAGYPSVVTAIIMGFIGLSIVTTIVTVLVMIPYDLDKKLPAITAELDKRRQSAVQE